ncbi:alpha/beta hydrolase [Fluviispira multicolorata]|uniref:Alpha/beta fold hydrolase n=1 Tax=Fluviispira multicolorata TaxID=2654512 RepID=A0A833N3A6_9BACT|nr:alpha/beta hydrolase [Fluviispira multicolorata]KAB8033668.1 alpha/beta fold hydrolase [Fluviispira multicolorata]
MKCHKNLILIKCILVSLTFSGCNNLFYYPDSKTQVTPDKLNLSYDNFNIKTIDNEELHGWQIYSKKKRPIATILHFHGNAQNISTHFLYCAWLAENGFDVFEFDYRGYGKSTGSPSRLGLYQDSLAFLQWAQQNSRTQDIFIIAQSIGGAVVIPAFVDSKLNNIQGIILDSTFASYRGIARQKLASIWLTWPLQWPLGFLVSDNLSPIDFIEKVHVPLVLIHSKNDNVVPYESGRELFEAALNPKEFWEVEWEGHVTAFAHKDDRYRRKLLKYLCSHLQKANKDCDIYLNENPKILPYIRLLPEIKNINK